jgi:hypothetical protein
MHVGHGDTVACSWRECEVGYCGLNFKKSLNRSQLEFLSTILNFDDFVKVYVAL